MYKKIKKQHFIVVINILIVLMFILGAFSSLVSISEKPHHEIQIQTLTGYSNKLMSPFEKNIRKGTDMVDPTEIYSKEPAPMGLADFGIENIDSSEQAYSYNTTSFLGSVHINSLSVVNSTTNSQCMTFQFNLNLAFYNGTNLYVYWVQDVVFVNTTTHLLEFIDNIWNMSSSSANMYNSTLKGNGTIGNSSGKYYYYDVANRTLPGNCIKLVYPSSVKFMVNSTITKNGQPEVDFMYNDGYGWVTYDNPIFTFVNDLTQDFGFIVDGYHYEPDGYSFYDAELILGGPGDGSCTSDMNSNITLNIQYWNSHNYQEIRSAYNFGTDTAETISNVLSGAYYYKNNGTLFENIIPGSGTLEQVYNSNDISTLNITMPLSSGTLYINGTPHKFINHEINLTIAPGDYKIEIYNKSLLFSQFKVNLTPGEYKQIVTNESIITFTENGLPTGTEWWVNLTGNHYHSDNKTISFYECNGSYTYIVTTSDHIYYPTLSSGSFTVIGKSVLISINFKELTYYATFTEKGLPIGTHWNLIFNGHSYVLTNSSYSFKLTNGTYDYSATSIDYRNLSTALNVNGKNVFVSLLFVLQKYNVTFEETGIISDSWYVNITDVNGTIDASGAITGSSYSFQLTNGTYIYSATSTNYRNISGTLAIHGKNIKISLSFTFQEYGVTFKETGLPAGIPWCVNLTNSMKSGAITGSSYSFQLTNGTYHYTLATSDHLYIPSTYTGTLAVSGKTLQVPVTFTAIKYNIIFKETGLPSGTTWIVRLNGINESSTFSTITFQEANGTYTYTVYNVSGYTVLPSGNITVNGSNITREIIYSQNPPEKAPPALSSIGIYTIGLITILLIAIGAIIIAIKKRK